MSSYFPKVTRARALAAIVVLLVLAALYEALVALQVIPMGKIAGDGPFGGGVVLLIALLTLCAALIVSLSGAPSAGSVWRSAVLVVAVFIVVGLAASAAVGGIGELIALLVLLSGIVTIVTYLAYASGWSAERRSVAPLVAPAAAAFVVARFYSFDDYYLPTLRRMSDGGWIPGKWIIVLAALALLAGVSTRIRPRLGIAMTSLALFMSVLTSIAVGIGH